MVCTRAKKTKLTALVLLLVLGVAATASAGYGPKLGAGKIGKRVLSSKRVSITGTDNFERFHAYCPRGKRPLGGGLHADPGPDFHGGGVFPTAYERLGQQQGWHTSVSQVHRGGTASITVQVLCARYCGNIDPQEKFIKSRTYKNVGAGQTKRFTQRCPRHKSLVTGGYLTSQLFDEKGVYVTESRMSGKRSWTVLAHGVNGGKGGQVSAIAYCVRAKHKLLREVAGDPASVTPGLTGTSLAPRCPGRRVLIAGGFSAPSSLHVFDGGFSGRNAWSASGVSYAGSGTVTAYGYCI